MYGLLGFGRDTIIWQKKFKKNEKIGNLGNAYPLTKLIVWCILQKETSWNIIFT